MPTPPCRHPTRRAALAALAAACTPAARASDATVRVLVGVAAGTVVDTVAREVAAAASAKWGAPAVVENRFSAGGILALDALRRASADGRTIAIAHAMQLSAAPALFRQLPYDPAADFTPLGLLFHGPQVLLCHPDLPARDWPSLLRLARSRPGALRYATPGVGSPQHLTMELLKAATGVDIGHVPFRGPAALQAVAAGDVEITLEGASLAQPLLQAARLRALAVTGTQRLAVLPELPTFEELGVAGIGTVWVGALAPRGLPPAQVQLLRDGLRDAVQSLSPRWAAAGRRSADVDPAAMLETMRQEIPRWREIVTRAGITPS